MPTAESGRHDEGRAELRPEVSRRRLITTSLVLGYVTTAVALAQSLLLVPVYLRAFPLELYGAWLASGNVLAWVDSVEGNVSGVLQQRVADSLGRDDGRTGVVIGTGLVTAILLSTIPLCLWPVAPSLVRVIELPSAFYSPLTTAFRVGLVSASVTIVGLSVLSVLSGLQLLGRVGAVGIVAQCLGLGGTLVLLGSGAGIVAIPGGLLVRAIAIAMGAVVLLIVESRRRPRLRLAVSGHEFRAIAHLATASLGAKCGTLALERTDLVLTATIISPPAAVALSVTGKLFEVGKMLLGRLAPAISPVLSHFLGRHGLSEALVQAQRVQLGIGAIAGVAMLACVALNPLFVSAWVGESAFGGHRLSALQGLAAGFWIVGATLAQFLFSMGFVALVSGTVLAEAAIRLPAQALLLRWLGPIGAPLGAALASVGIGAVVLLAGARRALVANRPMEQAVYVGFVRVLVGAAGGAGLGALLSLVMLENGQSVAFATWFVAAVVGSSIWLWWDASARGDLVRLVRRTRLPVPLTDQR